MEEIAGIRKPWKFTDTNGFQRFYTEDAVIDFHKKLKAQLVNKRLEDVLPGYNEDDLE